jgi:hypothetical protein
VNVFARWITVSPGTDTTDLPSSLAPLVTPLLAISRARPSAARVASRSAAAPARVVASSTVRPILKPFACSAARSAAVVSMLSEMEPSSSTCLYSTTS